MIDTNNYLYHTYGMSNIVKMDWQKPEMQDDQAEVESVLTGVCRSDIDMYAGAVPSLPVGIFGHEGLGIVRKAGRHSGAKEGDIVSTRSDAAFAKVYNTRVGEFVKVPEINPKYIIEPVACGYNIGKKIAEVLNELWNPNVPILVYGSGFLSYTAIAYILDTHHELKDNIKVIGGSYKDVWKDLGIELTQSRDVEPEKYKIVALLTDKIADWIGGIERAASPGSYIIAGAVPSAISKPTLFQASWKNQTWLFPSPRDKDFIERMRDAAYDIESNILKVDWAWTAGYAESQISEAFSEGYHRPPTYCRGYIDWRLGKS